MVVALAAPQPEIRLGALRRARQLLPQEPALGWAIADALRDTADLEGLAGSNGLALHEIKDMPANNLILVFARASSAPGA